MGKRLETEVIINHADVMRPLKNLQIMGFPHRSVGKESACNAGDPDLIPGLGRYSGEGIGYRL